MTLSKWMRQSDVDDGNKPGTTRSESAELRDARRRIRLLEQENEVLRRAAAYLSQAQIPGKGSTRSWKRLPPKGFLWRCRAGCCSSLASPTTGGWPIR